MISVSKYTRHSYYGSVKPNIKNGLSICVGELCPLPKRDSEMMKKKL